MRWDRGSRKPLALATVQKPPPSVPPSLSKAMQAQYGPNTTCTIAHRISPLKAVSDATNHEAGIAQPTKTNPPRSPHCPRTSCGGCSLTRCNACWGRKALCGMKTFRLSAFSFPKPCESSCSRARTYSFLALLFERRGGERGEEWGSVGVGAGGPFFLLPRHDDGKRVRENSLVAYWQQACSYTSAP